MHSHEQMTLICQTHRKKGGSYSLLVISRDPNCFFQLLLFFHAITPQGEGKKAIKWVNLKIQLSIINDNQKMKTLSISPSPESRLRSKSLGNIFLAVVKNKRFHLAVPGGEHTHTYALQMINS